MPFRSGICVIQRQAVLLVEYCGFPRSSICWIMYVTAQERQLLIHRDWDWRLQCTVWPFLSWKINQSDIEQMRLYLGQTEDSSWQLGSFYCHKLKTFETVVIIVNLSQHTFFCSNFPIFRNKFWPPTGITVHFLNSALSLSDILLNTDAIQMFLCAIGLSASTGTLSHRRIIEKRWGWLVSKQTASASL